MAIDIDSDVAEILGDDPDVAKTSATWTQGSTTDEDVAGILLPGERIPGPEDALDLLTSTLIVDKDLFVNVAKPGFGDTWGNWTCQEVHENLEHYAFALAQEVLRGT